VDGVPTIGSATSVTPRGSLSARDDNNIVSNFIEFVNSENVSKIIGKNI